MTQLTKTPAAGQFSVRSLLVAMTLAAVFFAIVGPTVGNSSAKNKIFVFVAWGGVLTGFLLMLAIVGLLICRAARRGGQVHFRLTTLPSGSHRRMLYMGLLALLAIVMFVFLVVGTGMVSDPRSWQQRNPSQFYFFREGFPLGVLAGMLVASLLYPADRFELREHGLVEWWILTPWNRVTEYQWSASHANHLVFKTRFGVRKVTVSEDQIPAVNDFLAKYAQREES